MARCYICGSPNANFRRTVHTGNSYGVGISSRGTSYSSARAYYGKRSVCAKCAFKIDYNGQKQKYYWSWILPALPLGGAITAQCLGEAELAVPFWIGAIVLSTIAVILTCIGKRKANNWAEENYYIYFPEESQKSNEFVLQSTMAEDCKNNLIESSEKMLKACSEQTTYYISILKNEFDGINGDLCFDADNKEETLKIFENKYCKIGFAFAILNVFGKFIAENSENIKNLWESEIKTFPQEDVLALGNKYIEKAEAAEKDVNDMTNKNTQTLIEQSEKIISFLKERGLSYVVEKIPHFLKLNAISENYQLLETKDRFIIFYEDTWKLASPTTHVKIKGDKINMNGKFMTEKEFVEHMVQAEILKQDKESRQFHILLQSALLYAKYAVKNISIPQETPLDEKLRNEFDYKMSDEEFCGYRLTLAQAEFLKGMSAENKEKICKISKDCVEKHYGTSKTRQELFDGTPGLNWDSWLFAILVKRNGVSDEKQTMFEYFSGFDELESIDLNCEYFKAYPDVKQEVIKHFEWLENPPKIDFKRIVAENGTAAKNFTGRSVKEILDVATSRGIYDEDITINKEFEKSYYHLESIKKTPSIGTLYEDEFKEILECVHNLICKSLAKGNYKFSIPELENFKYNFDTTNTQMEELVKPFYEFNDGIIRNRYFNDLCRDFCNFQYRIYFPSETDAYYFSVIKNLWTDTDEKILRLICGKYTHPRFIAESFFTTYFKETERLDIILKAASSEIKGRWNIEEQSVSKVLSPFVEMINKQNDLHCGVSIKKNKFTDEIFLENKTTSNFYLPYEYKPKHNVDESLSLLKKYAELIGKCPNIKELDTPTFNHKNEIDVIDLWYSMPYSIYYKEKYGSIKNAFKVIAK